MESRERSFSPRRFYDSPQRRSHKSRGRSPSPDHYPPSSPLYYDSGQRYTSRRHHGSPSRRYSPKRTPSGSPENRRRNYSPGYQPPPYPPSPRYHSPSDQYYHSPARYSVSPETHSASWADYQDTQNSRHSYRETQSPSDNTVSTHSPHQPAISPQSSPSLHTLPKSCSPEAVGSPKHQPHSPPDNSPSPNQKSQTSPCPDTKSELVNNLFSNFVEKSWFSSKKTAEEEPKAGKHKTKKKHKKEKKESKEHFASKRKLSIQYSDETVIDKKTKKDKTHAKKKKKHKHKRDGKSDKKKSDDDQLSKKQSLSQEKRADKKRTAHSSGDEGDYITEQFEKAYEHKLENLKKNLEKRHQEMKDLMETYTIPEKKIRLHTDVFLQEKRKEEQLNSVMNEEANKALHSEGDAKLKETVSKALWQPRLKRPEDVEALEQMDVLMRGVMKNEEMKDSKSSSEVINSKAQNPKEATDSQANSKQETKDADGNKSTEITTQVTEEKKSLLSQSIIIGKRGKTSLRLGLKISELSAQLIRSGTDDGMVFGARLEEGELSEAEKSDKSESGGWTKQAESVEAVVKEHVSDVSLSMSDTDGALPDSEVETSGKKKKKRKKEKKKEKGKRKDRSRERDKRHTDEPSRSRDRDRRSGFDDFFAEEKFRRSGGDRKYDDRERRRSRDRWRDERSGRGRNDRGDRDHEDWRKERSLSPRGARRSPRRHGGSREGHPEARKRGGSAERGENQLQSDLRIRIDKAKLRKIAMKNAKRTIESVKDLKPEHVAALRAGGRSVEELVDYCKRIQDKAKARGDESSDAEHSPDVDSDENDSFHHPFLLRPQPASVVMNIRNAQQLPTMSYHDRISAGAELRLQFPVSSGSQHKNKEGQWTPVQPDQPPAKKDSKAVPSEKKKDDKPVVAAATTAETAAPATAPVTPAAAPAAPAAAPATPAAPPADAVFAPPKANVDVGSIVSERLSALRRLQDNPHDVQALTQMFKVQSKMDTWVQSKQLPGQFTGHSELNRLSKQALTEYGSAPWARKDTFRTAAPIAGGIGRTLLQKMGWKEGSGLGREESGCLVPLALDIKTDRRGLHGTDEVKAAQNRPKNAPIRDMSGKHPVSVVMELCKRRRWPPPRFEDFSESGPAHRKMFVVNCVVNGIVYQPSVGSTTKKLAKAQAAAACLMEMGLIPRETEPAAAPPAT